MKKLLFTCFILILSQVHAQDKDSVVNILSLNRGGQKLQNTPASVQVLTQEKIKNLSSYYNYLENLGEAQFNTSGLNSFSLNTRGFSDTYNTRFVHFSDGAELVSPGYNAVFSDLLNVSQLDLHQLEMVSGANSSIYGANALNGALFMYSKNPFENEGLSVYAKRGVTSQSGVDNQALIDAGVRIAGKVYKDKLAAKANFSFFNTTDWQANNYTDRFISAVKRDALNYDGVNEYGDENVTNINNVAQQMVDLEIIQSGFENVVPNANVSRTGYKERELTDYASKKFKGDVALHYRPFSNDLEVSLSSRFGTTSGVFQETSRYMLKDFMMAQHKFEVKNRNFVARLYQTQQNSGDSYNLDRTGTLLTKSFKSDQAWYQDYVLGFLSGLNDGYSDEIAYALARENANVGRFAKGSPEYNQAFDKITKDSNFATGSKMIDKSKMQHAEINYNFKELISFVDLQLGASYRKYLPQTAGTLLNDGIKNIEIGETGVFTQISKKLLQEKIHLSTAIRYDKHQNFDAQISPKLTLLYSLGAKKDNSIWVSGQTAYRNPTIREQYTGLNTGGFSVVGSENAGVGQYAENIVLSTNGFDLTGNQMVEVTGNDAYNNAFTASSVQNYLNAIANEGASVPYASTKLEKVKTPKLKPEQLQSVEFGYRGIVKKIKIETNLYYNQYKNFIQQQRVITPLYGNINDQWEFNINSSLMALHALNNGDVKEFLVYKNTNSKVSSLGVGTGISAKIYRSFELGGHYHYTEFMVTGDDKNDFKAGFNSPKHRVKISLENQSLTENVGFGLNVRWNTAYEWQSSYLNGKVPENTVLDFRVHYSIQKLKSRVMFSALNMFSDNYIQVPGSAMIGKQYAVSLIYNP